MCVSVDVAQLVEHSTHKAKVTGSIPVVDTKKTAVGRFYYCAVDRALSHKLLRIIRSVASQILNTFDPTSFHCGRSSPARVQK